MRFLPAVSDNIAFCDAMATNGGQESPNQNDLPKAVAEGYVVHKGHMLISFYDMQGGRKL